MSLMNRARIAAASDHRFLESEEYEDAIRLAISLGGDADTLASITGGIAGAFYGGVPQPIAARLGSWTTSCETW